MNKEIEPSEINSIIAAFREVSSVDFSNYAPSSLKRRFIRFMEIKRIHDSQELLYLTKTNKIFAQEFLNEVTVNVTEMFRDPDFWKAIRLHVFPILAKKEKINIWHAACSSGEEAFSMAILLKEFGLLEKTEILATDINLQALEMAKIGLHPKKKYLLSEQNYNELNSGHKLSEYFDLEENHNIFKKELMKHISFKKHDLVSGIGTGIFDMIICRNVFIYFNRNLQEKVLNMFANSLNDSAFLGIGSKESIAWCRSERYFKSISSEEKIFIKKNFQY